MHFAASGRTCWRSFLIQNVPIIDVRKWRHLRDIWRFKKLIQNIDRCCCWIQMDGSSLHWKVKLACWKWKLSWILSIWAIHLAAYCRYHDVAKVLIQRCGMECCCCNSLEFIHCIPLLLCWCWGNEIDERAIHKDVWVTSTDRKQIDIASWWKRMEQV